jgi:hypothetical protein
MAEKELSLFQLPAIDMAQFCADVARNLSGFAPNRQIAFPDALRLKWALD